MLTVPAESIEPNVAVVAIFGLTVDLDHRTTLGAPTSDTSGERCRSGVATLAQHVRNGSRSHANAAVDQNSRSWVGYELFDSAHVLGIGPNRTGYLVDEMAAFAYVEDHRVAIDVDLGGCLCSVRVHASEPSDESVLGEPVDEFGDDGTCHTVDEGGRTEVMIGGALIDDHHRVAAVHHCKRDECSRIDAQC